jgi:hypothetical protein
MTFQHLLIRKRVLWENNIYSLQSWKGPEYNNRLVLSGNFNYLSLIKNNNMPEPELRTSVHNEKKSYSILPAWNGFQIVSGTIHVLLWFLNFHQVKYKNMTPAAAFEHVRSKRARVLLTHSQWKVLKTP